MSSNSNALTNASNDANQNMSPAPAASSSQSCGDASSSPDAADPPVSPSKSHWIAIQLVDEEGHAVPGEDYKVTLPDGTVVEGCLDTHGKAKINGIESGDCAVSFPNLDKESWKKG
jgi:hypothetical protein